MNKLDDRQKNQSGCIMIFSFGFVFPLKIILIMCLVESHKN